MQAAEEERNLGDGPCSLISFPLPSRWDSSAALARTFPAKHCQPKRRIVMSPHRMFVRRLLRVALLVPAALLLAAAPLVAAGEDKELLATLKGHRGKITLLSFSPDGQRLLTAGADNKVLLWNARTGGKPLAQLTATGLGIPTAAAWTPA